MSFLSQIRAKLSVLTNILLRTKRFESVHCTWKLNKKLNFNRDKKNCIVISVLTLFSVIENGKVANLTAN